MSVVFRRSHRADAWSALIVALGILLTLGCGEDAPTDSGLDADAFRGVSESVLDAQIEDARTRAQQSDRRVLLEFVADWCEDCHEVVRLSRQPAARAVIEERYVVVFVDIGRNDRHRALAAAHQVDRIATLVVLDPESGDRVARTTLEPITGAQRGLTSQALADWLRAPRDG